LTLRAGRVTAVSVKLFEDLDNIEALSSAKPSMTVA